MDLARCENDGAWESSDSTLCREILWLFVAVQRTNISHEPRFSSSKQFYCLASVVCLMPIFSLKLLTNDVRFGARKG